VLGSAHLRAILDVVWDADYFTEPSFELAWPRQLLKTELARLLQRGGAFGITRSDAWNAEVELLIGESFVHAEPLGEFNRANNTSVFDPGPPLSGQDRLLALQRHIDALPAVANRPPYWSQRRNGTAPQRKSNLADTARRFGDVVEDLDNRGYFQLAFGKDCVDGSTIGKLGSEPAAEIHRLLGRDLLWPPSTYSRTYELDDLCDMIEFGFDYVSRPTTRWHHSFSGCGWHYSDYHAASGKYLYRYRINTILSGSDLNLTLNEDGRLEQTAPDELEALIEEVRADNSGGSSVPEIRHALNQFRARGATTLDKRSAVVTLAGILEPLRDTVLKKHLVRRDEGDIFHIANAFGIRHQRADQKTDYDQDLYLEWIFYWYLATVNLARKIVSAGTPTTTSS
jgi:hypothetical protein